MNVLRAVTTCVLWLSVIPIALAAQDDYRHVDQGRPLRVEDAYPIKFGEWEWEIGAGAQIAEGGEFEASNLLELKTGIARNFQFGVEVHSAASRVAGFTSTRVESFAGHLLFNLNQEGVVFPAVGVRGDLTTPGVGDLGRDDFGGTIRTMLTRTFGYVRAHINGAYTWASDSDGGDYWAGGLALDYALGLSSRLLLGDVYIEVPAAGGDERVWVDFGSRMQLNKTMVLDFALFSRIDEWSDGTPNVGFTIGLSRGFGFAGLVSVPAYPNPRIN